MEVQPSIKNEANTENREFVEGGCPSVWPMISSSTKPTTLFFFFNFSHWWLVYLWKSPKKKANIYCHWCDADSISTPSVPIMCLGTVQISREEFPFSARQWWYWLIWVVIRCMEKTRLVSWRGKPRSFNWFILQPWRCRLLFAPFYTDLSLNFQWVSVDFPTQSFRWKSSSF